VGERGKARMYMQRRGIPRKRKTRGERIKGRKED